MGRANSSERVAVWRDRIGRQAASGLSVAEFCAREGISVPSFYQWRRRLSPRVETPGEPRPRRVGAGNGASGRSGFAELIINHGLQAHACLPGGITIALGTQPDIARLIVDRLVQQAFGATGSPCTDSPATRRPGVARSC